MNSVSKANAATSVALFRPDHDTRLIQWAATSVECAFGKRGEAFGTETWLEAKGNVAEWQRPYSHF